MKDTQVGFIDGGLSLPSKSYKQVSGNFENVKMNGNVITSSSKAYAVNTDNFYKNKSSQKPIKTTGGC